MPGARLTLEQRTRIEAHWVAGRTIPEIAGLIGKDRTTVWREVGRHHSYTHGPKNPTGSRDRRPGRPGLYRWGYSALWAHRHAHAAARRPRPAKLSQGQPLRPV